MSQHDDRERLFADWDRDFRGTVAKFSRSYARNAREADELAQEMRIQLWHSTGSFKGEALASTWVYRVCLNTAISWRRRPLPAEGLHEPDWESVASAELSPAQSATKAEVLAQLYAAIRHLPEVDRGLVLLALDGVSYREVASITGMTENHVGVALTRARKKLAELMKGDAK